MNERYRGRLIFNNMSSEIKIFNKHVSINLFFYVFCLFISDGNIRYYEFENDELHYLSEYKSSEPQRGMSFLPKRSVNISECEIARAYKVANNLIEPISFVVPRKVFIIK